MFSGLQRPCLRPTAPVSSAPLDPKVLALTQQLDSMDRDLASTEDSMLSRLRSPLSRTDPESDLADRLMEQQVDVFQILQCPCPTCPCAPEGLNTTFGRST